MSNIQEMIERGEFAACGCCGTLVLRSELADHQKKCCVDKDNIDFEPPIFPPDPIPGDDSTPGGKAQDD